MSAENNLKFLVCNIDTNEIGNVTMSVICYLRNISELQLSRHLSKEPKIAASSSKLHENRISAIIILYFGQVVLPEAYFFASKLQQRLGKLRVFDITDRTLILQKLSRLALIVTFRRPPSITVIQICTLSDSLCSSKSESYEQTAVLCGLNILSKT